MGNGTLDPRSLREKAEALVTFTREGPLFIAWVQAVTDALEPASKPAKVECPNCGEPEEHYLFQDDDGAHYSCKPAQPEPVAEEMPEAVRGAVGTLREFSRNLAMRDGFYSARDSRVAREAADALESFWRTHAAQPAKVRMTEELERALCFAERKANGTESRVVLGEVLADIQAVRTQAAEAGKVRLPKVNEALWLLRKRAMEKKDLEVINEAQREVDAAEGRK